MKLHHTILAIAFSVSAYAQKATLVKQDSVNVRNKFLPTGIRLGTDLISIGKSKYVSTFTGWEVNADADFYRYFLTVDYGSWGRTYLPDSAIYANTGKYFRLGVDANFLKKDPEKNAFFIGFRYGHSVFSEDLNGIFTYPNGGRLVGHFVNNNVKANWLELTSGIRVKMWKFIWMGYTARYKFALNLGRTQELKPSDVPGFGRTDKPATWGFNYQIFIRIPVAKKQ